MVTLATTHTRIKKGNEMPLKIQKPSSKINAVYSNPVVKKVSLLLSSWIILVFVWGPTTIKRQSISIDEIRYWFLGDDVMISMRYARNFADGLGLVWNSGERVEGYTNFAWVMVMSVVHYIGVPDNLTSFYIIAFNIFLQLVLFFILFRLIQEITERYYIAFIITVAFTIVDISSMVWGTSGFEMTLISVLVAYCTHRIIHESKLGEIRLFTFFVLGLIALVRADGIVITVLFLGFILLFTGITRRNLLGSVLATLPFIFHVTFRYGYYGEFAPNTATLKLFDLKDRITYGVGYFFIFLRWYWMLLLLISIQVLRDLASKKYIRPLIFLGSFIYAAYLVYVGGDGIGNNRFFVSVIPLIFVLGATTLVDLFNRKLAILLTIGILLFARFSTLQIDFFDNEKHIVRYSSYMQGWSPSHDGVLAGVYLNTVKGIHDSLAVFPAGQSPYFSMIYAIDMLGKSDQYIAKLDEVYGNRPGHNKFDAVYSMARKPSYVFPGLYRTWPSSKKEQVQLILGMEGDDSWLYDLFTNTQFVTYCLPNPVDTGGQHALFQCKWE